MPFATNKWYYCPYSLLSLMLVIERKFLWFSSLAWSLTNEIIPRFILWDFNFLRTFQLSMSSCLYSKASQISRNFVVSMGEDIVPEIYIKVKRRPYGCHVDIKLRKTAFCRHPLFSTCFRITTNADILHFEAYMRDIRKNWLLYRVDQDESTDAFSDSDNSDKENTGRD